jgi:ATP/maltotriose-dependent transcriptional regulator MalT
MVTDRRAAGVGRMLHFVAPRLSCPRGVFTPRAARWKSHQRPDGGRLRAAMAAPTVADVRAAIEQQDWVGALEFADAVGTDDAAETAVLADLRAEATWWLGRVDECIEAREAAYRGYLELGRTRDAGQCAVWLWEHQAISARPAIAGAWLRRARNALDGDTQCVEYGALRLREAETADGEQRHADALDMATEALELARSLGSADLEAEALQTKGRILIGTGQMPEGMRHLDEAMLFAVEGRLGPYSTGKVYCSLISACEEVGDLERAAEWTEATLQWAERHPFAIFPGICRVHRAVILKQRGDFVEAERQASIARDELRHSHVGNAASACIEIGDIRRRLGDLAGAAAAFANAQELCGGQCAEVALLRLAEGRVDLARGAIATCMATTPTNSLARSRLLPAVTQVAIADGNLVMAAAAVAELEELAARFASPFIQATLESARGRLQLALGAPPDAQETLRRALVLWQRLAVPYEVATTWTLLGEASEQAGDAAAASEAFATAVEQFDRIGAHFAVTAPPDDADRPNGLTAREVEVLQLVAVGHTNQGIADELFLSVKTVSRHLSNIYTKIGVSSRSAATAFAFEHGLAGRAPD